MNQHEIYLKQALVFLCLHLVIYFLISFFTSTDNLPKHSGLSSNNFYSLPLMSESLTFWGMGGGVGVLHFFPSIVDNCNYGSLFKKSIKLKMFFLLFTIIYPTWLLLRQCLSNNLPTHIRENIDFSRWEPRQLPNAEPYFESCNMP